MGQTIIYPTLLKLTGLTEAAKLYPSELSGGMQQRTALARTLALQADLILMDEPFAALDYFTRGQLQLELLRMQRQLGIGYVLVTHNVDEALLLGDRILVLQDGCLAHEETFPRQEAPRDLLSPAYWIPNGGRFGLFRINFYFRKDLIHLKKLHSLFLAVCCLVAARFLPRSRPPAKSPQPPLWTKSALPMYRLP